MVQPLEKPAALVTILGRLLIFIPMRRRQPHQRQPQPAADNLPC